MRLPMHLQRGHLGEDFAAGLTPEDFRAARPSPFGGGGRGHGEVGGEGVALRLVVEVLKVGVRTLGDVVDHVVGAGDAAEFDDESLLAAVLLAAVAGVLPVEGLRGRLGHDLMLEDLLFKVHAALLERLLLQKKQKVMK